MSRRTTMIIWANAYLAYRRSLGFELRSAGSCPARLRPVRRPGGASRPAHQFAGAAMGDTDPGHTRGDIVASVCRLFGALRGIWLPGTDRARCPTSACSPGVPVAASRIFIPRGRLTRPDHRGRESAGGLSVASPQLCDPVRLAGQHGPARLRSAGSIQDRCRSRSGRAARPANQVPKEQAGADARNDHPGHAVLRRAPRQRPGPPGRHRRSSSAAAGNPFLTARCDAPSANCATDSTWQATACCRCPESTTCVTPSPVDD